LLTVNVETLEMRLRRLEFAVIAITLAFICFMGGYFTGRRGAVNVVTFEPKQDETQHVAQTVAPPGAVASEQPTVGGGGAEAPGVSVQTPDSEDGETANAVTETEQPQEAVGAPKGGDGKININLASQSELMDLPGIGSVIASRIVDYRRQHGDFSRIEDLRKVSGIGEKRFEAIQEKITVG